MATLAREKNNPAVYLIDEITGTRRHLAKTEYAALKALGWPTAVVVPDGTLTVFAEIQPWVPTGTTRALAIVALAKP